MVVRVTRLMEYEFRNVEDALRNMEAWQVPPNGARTFGTVVGVRSAVIGPVSGEAAERIHTAVPVAEEDPSIERAEEMRQELAGVLGLNPTAPASLWEEMLRVIGVAGPVAPGVYEDLVRRARDLVDTLSDAGPSAIDKDIRPEVTLYRDRLRHWLQTYTSGADKTEEYGPDWLIRRVAAEWTALDPGRRMGIRKFSEDLYDALGTASTWVATHS